MILQASRREFLSRTLLAGAGLALPASLRAAPEAKGFSFVLLGDLHFDRLEHHDLAWLEKEKPDDVRQVRDYTRISAEILPQLFATVRARLDELPQTAQTRAAFVLQVGDFVEGLCGNEKLAVKHHEDAIAFVRTAKWGVPFLFTKGNHDVTGPGAPEAYRSVFHPFLTEQSKAFKGGGALSGACFAVKQENALFTFFDAYDQKSLEWLEATLARRTAAHCFVVVHPPVVPYGARSTWHLCSGERQKARREQVLELLGKHNAIVLSGHIHKYSLLDRKTRGGGRFTQLAVSSVISRLDVQPKSVLTGLDQYTADQVRVEPNFSPATEAERRAVYDREAPLVTRFEYADLPGYAVVTVNGPRVKADVFGGVSRTPWRTLDLASA